MIVLFLSMASCSLITNKSGIWKASKSFKWTFPLALSFIFGLKLTRCGWWQRTTFRDQSNLLVFNRINWTQDLFIFPFLPPFRLHFVDGFDLSFLCWSVWLNICFRFFTFDFCYVFLIVGVSDVGIDFTFKTKQVWSVVRDVFWLV